LVTTYYRSKLFRNENVDRNEYRNKEHKDTRIQGLERKDRRIKKRKEGARNAGIARLQKENKGN
jgi:hypothetical protein